MKRNWQGLGANEQSSDRLRVQNRNLLARGLFAVMPAADDREGEEPRTYPMSQVWGAALAFKLRPFN